MTSSLDCASQGHLAIVHITVNKLLQLGALILASLLGIVGSIVWA